MIFFKIT